MEAREIDNTTSDSGADVLGTAVNHLERQLERGSLFTHTAIGENTLRLGEVESFTYGLIDALISKGVVSSEEVSEAATSVRQQLAGNGEMTGIGVAIRIDKPEAAEREPAMVDCASRLHICHAACCKLDFPLSTSEIEEGQVKWDLGRPYFIRRESDGHCTHINRTTGGCSLYANRPSVCRAYSCANDRRIWKDFEKMELNHEWLAENLSPTRPRALRVLMHSVEPISEPCSGLTCEQSEDGAVSQR
jgi:Fe-S-cluster containining protein